ncbi:hypothetical protein NN561_005920 [Cricetulus griseus]
MELPGKVLLSTPKMLSLVHNGKEERKAYATSPGSRCFISSLISWQITQQNNRKVSGMNFLKLCTDFPSLTPECLFISVCIRTSLCLIPESFPAYLRMMKDWYLELVVA